MQISHFPQLPVQEASTAPHAQLVAQSLPVVLFTLDDDGFFLAMEGRGCAQMGLEPALVVGRRFSEVFADAAELSASIDQALTASSERRWTAAFRGHFWDFHSKPLLAPDGLPIGLIGVALNVTQHRHAEAKIRWNNREISALNLITAELTSTLELSTVLTTLEQQLAEHLNILGGAVYLLGITGLELYTAWGIPTDLIAHTSRLMLARSFSPDNLRVNPYLLDSLFAGSVEEDPQWQSTVAIPLICNHQSWGYLVLYDAEPLAFGKHRPAFFEMLGHQLGAALQNARMFRTVVEGREELRHLTHRLVAAQEAEQARLARELHDEFGQILTCMKLTLEMAEQAGIAPDAVAHLAQARSLSDDMLAHVRHMTFELRTTILDDLGLIAALQWYTDRFTAQTGINIRLTQRGFEPGQRFPEPVEIAAYRIVQETLTNVARHADTEEASITLSIPNTAVRSPLRLAIEDFGQGFDIHQRRLNTSNGLTGMRERAAALGGTVVIHSSPGRGTRVEVLLPVENQP